MNITLPYPPTVNTYYRRSGHTIHISARGKKYRKNVEVAVLVHPCRVLIPYPLRLSVVVMAYMPDKRRRDIDNILKSLLDSLCHAGVFLDDEQIDRLVVQRCGVEPPGRVEVSIMEFGP